MKPESDNAEASQWVKKASLLHKAIKSVRLNMKTEFPQNEHLQPQDVVRKELIPRLHLFLNYDVTHLVRRSELEALLIEAKDLGISKGNILHSELLKSYSKIKELRSKINAFTSSSSKNYSEAKHLFSSLLESGIWIEEAEVIRRIIHVNRHIEGLLALNDSECYHGLKDVKEIEGKFIDPAFKLIIASRFQECQVIKRKLDHLFQKETLGFDDFELIDKLVKDCRNLHHFIPNHDKLISLYKSFVWTLELAYQCKLKTKYLNQLVFLLLERIKIDKERGQLKETKETLKEVSTITYTQLPLKLLVQQCQTIVWDEEVKDYLEKPLFRKEEIKSLLERAPIETFAEKGEAVEFSTLKNMFEKMKTWESQVEIICRQTTELRTCEPDTFSKRMNSSLNQIEEAIKKAHEDYKSWLNKVEEFQKLKTQLDFSEKVLVMSKCVFRINNKKKIEHVDYQKAKELFKEGKSHKYLEDILFVAFKKLLRLLNKDVKLLKEVYFKIVSKETHATPDLYEPKFIVYAKDLNKAESALKAISQVEDYIYLGEFGVIIKNFISEFKVAEASLLALIQEFPSIELSSYKFEKIKEIIEDFSLRKQKWRVRLYSPYLEQLARYEWLLNSLLALKAEQSQFEVIERLANCSEMAMQDDREVVKSLQVKLKLGKALMEKVDKVLSSSLEMTVDDLKEVKKQLDSSPVISKSQKKQIDNEYQSYELVEHDFQLAKISGNDGSTNTLEELKVLLADACSLRYKAPVIEKTLMEAIHSSEHLLKSIDQNKPVQEIVESIERYRATGIAVKEVDVVLTNRQVALNYLNQDNLNIDRMNQQELKLLEKCIFNSLDLSYKERFASKILRRKYTLLNSIEKKGQEAAEENKIKLHELLAIFEQMKEASGGFNNDELEYIQEKINQTNMYLDQLKKVKEETLKRCMKVLFYFLDISEQVKQIQKNFQPIPSVLDKLLNQDEAKDERHKEEARIADNLLTQELLEKNGKKQLRRDLIKGIRKTILRFYPGLTKAEATDYAKVIENSIYQETKSDMLVLGNLVADYKRLIEKCHEKLFIIELIITKPISLKLLEFLLNDGSAEFKGLRDIVHARRYLRSMELNLAKAEKGSGHHESATKLRGDQDASLGKRGVLRPFQEEDLHLLQAAQKRSKVDSAEKQKPISIHENISLDTPETRKALGFKAGVHQVVDMEDVDDDSRPFSNSSLNNSMSQEEEPFLDQAILEIPRFSSAQKPDITYSMMAAQKETTRDLILEVREKVVITKPSAMLQEVAGDSVDSNRMPEDNRVKYSGGDSEVMKAEACEEEDVKSYMEFELVGKLDYRDMEEEELEGVDREGSNEDAGLGLEENEKGIQSENGQGLKAEEAVGTYEVFHGTMMFESLMKAVADLKLIVIGNLTKASQIPLFHESSISFQRELTTENLERDLTTIKRAISRKECEVFSGFVSGENRKLRVLGEIQQEKNSVYFSSISNGLSLYYFSKPQATTDVRSLWTEEEASILEAKNFTWTLFLENKAKIEHYVKPKEFQTKNTSEENGHHSGETANVSASFHQQGNHGSFQPMHESSRMQEEPIKSKQTRGKH